MLVSEASWRDALLKAPQAFFSSVNDFAEASDMLKELGFEPRKATTKEIALLFDLTESEAAESGLSATIWTGPRGDVAVTALGE
jgi:hypothetical protein